MNSTKTIRVSQIVYDKIKQELRQQEVVDDVLRRVFALEPKAQRPRIVARRNLFLRVRGEFLVVGLARMAGMKSSRGTRYKLPLYKHDVEKNTILRKKVMAYATRNGISDTEIPGIERYFRRQGYLLRRRMATTAKNLGDATTHIPG